MGQSINNGYLYSDLHIQFQIRATGQPCQIILQRQQIINSNLPNPKQIEEQVGTILVELILTKDQQLRFKNAPDELKWLLIKEYKRIQGSEMINLNFGTNSQQKAQFFIDLFSKNNSNLLDLECFTRFIKLKSTQEDLDYFVFKGGASILTSMLGTAELDSRETRNYMKTIMILRIIELMMLNEQFRQQLLCTQTVSVIVLCFHPVNVEIVSIVLKLASYVCWLSNEGFDLVFSAFKNNQIQKQLDSVFQPLLQALQSSNVVMVGIICTFLNTLGEAPTNHRDEIKQILNQSKMERIIAMITQNLEQNYYELSESSYEIVLQRVREFNGNKGEDGQRDPNYIEELRLPVLYYRQTRDLYIYDNQEFEQQKINIIRQIAAFQVISNQQINNTHRFQHQPLNQNLPNTIQRSKSKELLQQKISNLQDQIKPLKQKEEDLIQKNKKLESEYAKYYRLYNQADDKVQKLQDQINQSEVEYQGQFAEIQEINQISNKDLKQLKKEYKLIQKELDSKIKELVLLRQMFSEKSQVEAHTKKIEQGLKTDSVNQVLKQNSATKLQTDRELLQISQDNLKYIHEQLDESRVNVKKQKEIIRELQNNQGHKSKDIIFNLQNTDGIQQFGKKDVESQFHETPVKNQSQFSDLQNMVPESEPIKGQISQGTRAQNTGNQSASPQEQLDYRNTKQKLKAVQRTRDRGSFGYDTGFQSTEHQVTQFELSEEQDFVVENKDGEFLEGKSTNHNTMKKSRHQNSGPQNTGQGQGMTLDQFSPGVVNNKTQSQVNDQGPLSNRDPLAQGQIKQETILMKSSESQRNPVQVDEGLRRNSNQGTPGQDKVNNGSMRQGNTGYQGVTNSQQIKGSVQMNQGPQAYNQVGAEQNSGILDSKQSPVGEIKENIFSRQKEPIKTSEVQIIPPQPPVVIRQSLRVSPPLPSQPGPGPPPPPGSGPPPPPPPPPPGIKNINDDQGKIKKKPSVPMKQVPWQILKKEIVKGTLWEHLDDSKLPLNFVEIEEMFAAKAQVSPGTKLLNSKPQKISLLAPERNKNLELILGKLKMSNTLIVESLWRIDDEILNPLIVESLFNAIPQEAERNLWAPEIDKETLSITDLFCMEIALVNGFESRLLSMRFKSNYKGLVDDLTLKIQRTEEIIKNTINSESIKILIEYILGVGNYLNGQSIRGGAFGFKLEMLEKISEVKTTDNKKNLLIYVIQKAEADNNKDLIQVDENLQDIELVAKTPISQLYTDLSDLKKYSKTLGKAIESQTQNDFDKVESSFIDFQYEIDEIIMKQEIDLKKCEFNFERLCCYFAETPKSMPSDKFFDKIHKFKIQCKQAKQSIIMAKQQEEKDLKKAQLKQKKI